MGESIWQAPRPRFPLLRTDVEVDVAVIGAGITGLLTAERLCRAGKRVAIIERHTILSGTTGHTTAQVTALLDTGYVAIESKFGKDAAKLVAASLTNAIADIEQTGPVTRLPAYHYAHAASAVDGLHRELEAARRAGLEATFLADVPFTAAEHGGILLTNQGEIRPDEILAPLAVRLTTSGCLIFENTPVTAIADGEPVEIETPYARARAAEVVIATHTPLGVSFLQTEVAPYRSYVIAARLASRVPKGLFFDTASPYHYVRSIDDLVLFGGCDHKVGGGGEVHAYEALEHYARQAFDVVAVPTRWSSQYYQPADGLPYIGRVHGHLYTATGFAGDGMPFGAVAARVLSDLIEGRKTAEADIYSPTRVKPVAGGKQVLKENMDVARHFVGDRLTREDVASLDDVRRGEGRLVQLGMHKVAAYRDQGGDLHVLSPVCTHMKCIVHWNAAEVSWDCPCHGGRFDVDGKPIEGPPVTNLKPYAVAEPRKVAPQAMPQTAS